MKKLLSLIVALVCIVSLTFAQSTTVAQFEKDTKGYKAFLYQSVIRVLNKDQNPDFNKLIKDLDHMRLVLSDTKGDEAMQTFKSVDAGIRSEGFELIMSFDNKDYKCNAYELASRNGKSTWVATFFTNDRAGVMEMKGMLDLKYIEALSSLNYEKLKQMIPIGN